MVHHCPICRKPTDSTKEADFPFCSERCRLKDLGNWATESYVVSEPLFDEDDESETPETPPRKPNSHADPNDPES
ncbi:MAG TPA: DNA gyrase inhibitor YacG [Chthoniobacteraceae bacterium]|jgi:hypothetical protein